LHEQPNRGGTIIEKFELHADVGFAVALLTGDDEARIVSSNDAFKRRPRQNVLFEFGYFIGKLGRNRVCALVEGDIEIPSDYQGVVYIALDQAGYWKFDLVRELKAVGFDVDANRAL
jgi:predicted nucleotide-binding protein